jgi:hypothetical protein
VCEIGDQIGLMFDAMAAYDRIELSSDDGQVTNR